MQGRTAASDTWNGVCPSRLGRGAVPADWAGSGTLVDAVAYANGLGSGTAYIQLQSNEIYITDTLAIDAGKKAVLDLNGNNILAELLHDFFTILTVDGTLTLKDTSSDNVADQGKLFGLTSDDAIGVYVRDGGNFTMEAGTITNRNLNNKGRGIKVVEGTVTMTGGSITENIVTGDAGGVYFDYYRGSFTMDNGDITGNTTGINGGGLTLVGYSFIGGTANISGNHKMADTVTTDNNLYLAFGEPLYIYPEPQEGFALGVNLIHKPSIDQPSSVTTTCYVYDTDLSGYFSSDDSTYETRYNDKKRLWI